MICPIASGFEGACADMCGKSYMIEKQIKEEYLIKRSSAMRKARAHPDPTVRLSDTRFPLLKTIRMISSKSSYLIREMVDARLTAVLFQHIFKYFELFCVLKHKQK